MKTYISILRGINVGGKRNIRMDDLQALYRELGFDHIITFIQSGNVLFQSGKNISDKEAARQIEQAILDKYSFEVPVMVRSIEEMQKTLQSNPFINKDYDVGKLHVTFLEDLPALDLLPSLGKYDYSPEEFVIIGKDVFLYCPDGYGKTRLSNNFFEQKLKVKATTRNWRTINKLFKIAMSEINLIES